MNILLPVLLFGLVYVVLILPQSRRRKQAAALQRGVEPGSKVLLTSGLYGTVIEIDDDALIIEAAEGVHLRYAKAAVLRVIPDLVDADDDQYDDDEDPDGAQGPDDPDETAVADHDEDTVARPSNREDPQGPPGS